MTCSIRNTTRRDRYPSKVWCMNWDSAVPKCGTKHMRLLPSWWHSKQCWMYCTNSSTPWWSPPVEGQYEIRWPLWPGPSWTEAHTHKHKWRECSTNHRRATWASCSSPSTEWLGLFNHGNQLAGIILIPHCYPSILYFYAINVTTNNKRSSWDFTHCFPSWTRAPPIHSESPTQFTYTWYTLS